ncbi:MAG TPA: hypothetical protein VFE94_02250 [Candidatus Paceibacterota bacterium]|nr:hypothetical protein [Candidatus Paceibacterota bacterium]
MAIELIPRREEKPVFGRPFFLIISTVVFVGVAAGVLVLEQLASAKKDELNSLQRTFVQDTRPQEEELARQLQEYRAKIENLRLALDQRQDVLWLFEFLEDTLHPDVFLTEFENMRENSFVFQGEAVNAFVLEQQRLVWEGQEGMQSVELKEIELLSSGRVEFQVEFVPAADFFGNISFL